jgi:DNA-binding PadR family transcriptional regulator
MNELSSTGRVILGMVSLGRRSGYDIKRFVDKTTRHFWAASYGQIYPELRRLEEQGMVASAEQPSGRRARTVYELTNPGRDALREWLEDSSEPLYELRCETMLKLFFSDAVEPERRVEWLRAFRELQERKLVTLRALEAPAAAMDADGPFLSLQFGLAQTEFLIAWSRGAEQRLAAGGPFKPDSQEES